MADYPVTPLTPPLTEQEIIRRQKLQKLLDADQNPYEITRWDVTYRSSQILAGFDELEGKEVSIAGRMTSRRIMGKASFAHLLDGEGDTYEYAIVGANEADPAADKISNESPVGAGLIGMKKNQTATILIPAGTIRYKILSIKKN